MIEMNMTGAAWLALVVTFGIAIMSPGPDVFMLLRLGVRDRRGAVLAALGIMVGNTIWTVASVAGVAALLRALPGVLPVLQVLGSAVLIWIGVQSIRSGLRLLRGPRDPGSEPVAQRVTNRPIRLGLLTNLSNPKALLFFAALFSQLLPANATLADRTLIVLVLTAIGVAWFVSFALLTSSSAFQRWFARATPYIDLAAGAVFILVAGAILVELVVTSLR